MLGSLVSVCISVFDASANWIYSFESGSVFLRTRKKKSILGQAKGFLKFANVSGNGLGGTCESQSK